jgi:CBS domain-containing protein
MTENLNLALDITTAEEGGTRGKPSHCVARVYVDLASSYLKGQGAPTITADCSTFAEFQREIDRLKAECDALLGEARNRLAGAPKGGPAPLRKAGEGEAGSEASAPEPSGDKPVKIGQEIRVEDHMTRDLQTMRRNDSLSIADELMKVGGFRHVVVLDDDNDEIAGVVSHRDIFYGALAWSTGQGKNAHEKTLDATSVKDVMQSKVITVAPDTALAEAAGTMLEHKIGCLPVIDENRVVGILTEGDLLALLTNADYTRVVDSDR